MKKQKTNKKLVVLLALALMSLVVLMSSFAKYTEKVKVSDTAKIAKWDVSMSAKQNILEHEYTTNLLATDGTNLIIAPGVKGEIPIQISNSGDVAVTISLTGEVSDTVTATMPIEFSTDGSTYTDLDTALGNLTSSATTINQGEANVDVGTLYWQWPYEVSGDKSAKDAADITDTTIGKESTTAAKTGDRTDYTLTLNMTATQVEPTK